MPHSQTRWELVFSTPLDHFFPLFCVVEVVAQVDCSAFSVRASSLRLFQILIFFKLVSFHLISSNESLCAAFQSTFPKYLLPFYSGEELLVGDILDLSYCSWILSI